MGKDCCRSPGGRCLSHYHRALIVVLTPLALLALPLCVDGKEAKCGFVMLLMATYWCTEAVPLAVTALIPVFLFPTLGILKAGDVCVQYFKEKIMMFTGSLMVALSLQKCNLHKRIAMKIILVFGTQPVWLMLGFMMPAFVLSMWLCNAATTATVIPVVSAVLDSLEISGNNGDEDAGHAVYNTVRDEGGDDKDGSHGDQKPHGKLTRSYGSMDDDVIVMKGGATERDDDVIIMKGGGVKESTMVGDSVKPSQADLCTCGSMGADSGESLCRRGSAPSLSDPPTLTFGRQGAFRKLCKGMLLAVPYAANIGGIATLNGAGPNPVMQGHADDVWAAHGLGSSPVTFATWMLYAAPVAVIMLFITWLWLAIVYIGPRGMRCGKESDLDRNGSVKAIIRQEYRSLGPIKWAEVAVLCCFISMVILWFFRSPGFMLGWADQPAFQKGYVTDAVVSIFFTFLLCVIPSQIPSRLRDLSGSYDTLLDWRTIQQKFPWAIIFLMGGGFALAEGSKVSGLSKWIADQLAFFSDWPSPAMVFIICLIVAFLTEVTNNMATCTLLMPIASELSELIGKNPLYLMFPIAVSTSFAFMLPSSGPANAIAFSFGKLRTLDMVTGGFILNFLGVAVLVLATETWGNAYFNFDELPWLLPNVTTTLAP